MTTFNASESTLLSALLDAELGGPLVPFSVAPHGPRAALLTMGVIRADGDVLRLTWRTPPVLDAPATRQAVAASSTGTDEFRQSSSVPAPSLSATAAPTPSGALADGPAGMPSPVGQSRSTRHAA